MPWGCCACRAHLGDHPEGGKVEAGLGRFGPYVVHHKGKGEKDYRSLKAEDDVLMVGLSAALWSCWRSPSAAAVAAPPSRSSARPRAPMRPIQLFDGPYGLYVKQGKVNASLPEGTTADTITLEQAVELLAAKAATGKGKGPARLQASRSGQDSQDPAQGGQEPAPAAKKAPGHHQDRPPAGQCRAGDQRGRQLMQRLRPHGRRWGRCSRLGRCWAAAAAPPLAISCRAAFAQPRRARRGPRLPRTRPNLPAPRSPTRHLPLQLRPAGPSPDGGSAKRSAGQPPLGRPSAPAPYRVTIKLPAADPSSPAEAVTEALRPAGVAFEVETIERVPAAGVPLPQLPHRLPHLPRALRPRGACGSGDPLCAPRPVNRSLSRRQARQLMDTAYLAAATALLWVALYYLPVGSPLFRLALPLPLALLQLRHGWRCAVEGLTVAGAACWWP